MKLEQSFDVAAPVDSVWEALIDIERVVPCLPGAAVTGRGQEEGSYDGTFSVKIGPTTASYSGKLKLEHLDEAAHSARLQANGTDRRGQGGARATITSTVQSTDGGGSRVDVVTDYQITGRLARFGRGGMIEDIAGRLLREFAQRLQASLAEGGVEAPGVAPQAEAPPVEQPATTAPPVAESAPPAAESAPPVAESAPPAAESAPPAAESAPPVAEPLQGGSLVASVMWERARRNPAGLAAVIAGLLVALALVRRRR